MFLKPFRVKTKTSVKSSDRKKLRTDIGRQYPSLDVDAVSLLIPNKEEMTATKIETCRDEHILVYSVGKVPVFYDFFKQLYPTVYTLWKFPDMLQSFRTWPPVVSKIQKGADLMLPGVIPDNPPGPRMFGKLQKGELVSVKLAGNKAPVAVGTAALSGEDMYMSALRGKGVLVMHVVGDALWEFGDKSMPPSIPEPIPSGANTDGDQEEAGGEEGAEALMGDLTIKGESAEALKEEETNNDEDEEEEEDDERDPVAEMDELFHWCFACAIKSKVKKGDLPLLTGNLLRNFMQPFSANKQLDVKKSSFKKFNKFLQEKVKDGYICIKEQKKGVDVIYEIDKSHLGLRGIDVPEVVETAPIDKPDAVQEDTFTPLTFIDVYCINGATLGLFGRSGFSKGDALIVSDVRESVTDYIKDNNLQKDNDKTQVTLDPVLAHVILKPAEGDLDHMGWEQVINRVMGKMQPGVAIIQGSNPPTIKKGKLEPVKIAVETRTSNKKVTVVENLEDYGLDLRVFSRLVQRSVACSCTVVASEQKGKSPSVVVQGNQINFLATTLLDKYQIPKRYITGLDAAPKQKKKR